MAHTARKRRATAAAQVIPFPKTERQRARIRRRALSRAHLPADARQLLSLYRRMNATGQRATVLAATHIQAEFPRANRTARQS